MVVEHTSFRSRLYVASLSQTPTIPNAVARAWLETTAKSELRLTVDFGCL